VPSFWKQEEFSGLAGVRLGPAYFGKPGGTVPANDDASAQAFASYGGEGTGG
jgi:hypothetical protein